MIDFLHYIVQASIVFTVQFLLFRLCFSRLTFHTVNRVFMLTMLPLSLIIPFIDLGIVPDFFRRSPNLPILLDDFEYIGSNNQQAESATILQLDVVGILSLLYIVVGLVFMIKLISNVFRILKYKRNAGGYSEGRYRIFNSEEPLVFSCFNWIFLPDNNRICMNSAVIEHEKLHGKAWHTMDLILAELFVILLWFNPFVYLFRRDLKTVHEYQVDSMILKSEIRKSDYLQLMLDNLLYTHRMISLCNYFNGLTIKKRVKMITKDKSSKWKLINYLLIIPIVAVMTMSFSDSVKSDGDIPSISPIKVGEYDRISSGYGMRMHPIKKVETFHNGIDFAAKEGAKIVATASGVIISAEFKEGSYGKMVVINHGGGYETWYTQMSDYAVKLGDKVKRGDVIGYVGSSGLSTGAHLHYEVRKDGKSVNPQDYIKSSAPFPEKR